MFYLTTHLTHFIYGYMASAVFFKLCTNSHCFELILFSVEFKMCAAFPFCMLNIWNSPSSSLVYLVTLLNMHTYIATCIDKLRKKLKKRKTDADKFYVINLISHIIGLHVWLLFLHIHTHVCVCMHICVHVYMYSGACICVCVCIFFPIN